MKKKVRSGDKALSEELTLIDKCEELLQKGNFLDETSFSEEEIQMSEVISIINSETNFLHCKYLR